MTKPLDFQDLIAQFLMITLAMTTGFTVMGQLTTWTPAIWIYGIFCAVVINSRRNRWKFLDLLYLRRTIIILGLVTTFAVIITGAIMLGVYTNIPLGVYIALGRGTTPVLITMAVTLIAIGIWQIQTNMNFV